MSFGKVYESTHFGEVDDSIGWGKAYSNLILKAITSSIRIFTDSVRYLTDNVFG
tara:strand:+ start:13272 stop:13433 length:162 start_codon:yes stop_codon:yes gene_type:complete